MDFLINTEELAALCGLPHIQQIAYLRGIKPYMDFKTGLVGVRRKISHQSIAEQLYIDPHQGIKGGSVSRQQVRRALAGLARAGVITIESEGLQLILKCVFVSTDFSAQNKADTNPTHQTDINMNTQHHDMNVFSKNIHTNADTAKPSKADIPPNIRKSFVFSSANFENFWSLYPEKKSKAQALAAFEALNPDDALMNEIMTSLQRQIEHRATLIVQNQWVANWKNPANWLNQRCWEDEIKTENKELQHAAPRHNTHKQSGSDFSWFPEESDAMPIERAGNVFPFNP